MATQHLIGETFGPPVGIELRDRHPDSSRVVLAQPTDRAPRTPTVGGTIPDRSRSRAPGS